MRTRRRYGKGQPPQLQRQTQGSRERPGRAAVRHNQLVDELREAGLGAIGGLGFVGLDTDADDPVVVTDGFKAARNKPLTRARKEATKLIAAERAAVEYAFAHLKSRRS
ncbi:hypothetical protein FB157_110171 [Streptomyces sp. BK340]|nr:hypothetical protein FB157_110171 [Streptomyces sp. BK340]